MRGMMSEGRMKRRDFLWVFGGATMALPLTAGAQQAKVHVIGILALGNPDPAVFLAVIREELARLGYVDGRNCRYEVRTAQGKAAQLPALASELVRLSVDVLVTWQTPPTFAARDASEEVPIVMVGVGDPVATGIVASLSRPGGNITGNTAIAAEIMSKNMELIRETLPKATRVAAFANTVDPFTPPYLQHIETAASRLGIAIERVMARPTEDADPYFQSMREKQVDAVIIQPTLLRPGVADLALKHQLPTFSMASNFPLSGGLMAYGANGQALVREGAVYVDKILKGQRPSELPIAQPTKFDLVINLKTAKALGLAVPANLITRADEVIE
ncbi:MULTISPECIES: ABC transporter substrate-binding protein [Bradyrhizobium]|jgi:putative ABC transport system substrate-binding protein|nr:MULTISPECIES: ABC transporter substrate-binding protein [Bradyrhizobium]